MQEYFNVAQAAKYCGYSPRYFARIAFATKIPKYGLRKNRFKRSDLDLWMVDSTCFCSREQSSKEGFRPVKL